MKDKISIGYADINFTGEDLFEEILSKRFNIIHDDDNPDIRICSIFGNSRYVKKGKIKILWIGENVRLNLDGFDYGIGFDYVDSPNYLRFPLWKFYLHLENRKYLIDELVNKRKIISIPNNFCAFIVTQSANIRDQFFMFMNKYKTVDSFGALFNNRPEILRIQEDSWTWQKNKINFLRNDRFKFIISFENSTYPGYTTEKLPDAMLCDSIPIYWGDPLVGKDFNTKSFINLFDYNNNFHLVIDKIDELMHDKSKYLEMYNEEWLTDEQKTRIYENELETFLFKKILKV